MFDTVLIANRGEISVRISRTLRSLGVRSVAVYSDADAQARHVLNADVAVRLGPASASQSYLSVERIIDAAISTGAQAIHPGYGFLAEKAGFAQACADAGIVFIGPSPSAIATMGDKINAKATVERAGVPVVPGASGEDLVDAAASIGFPILVKPSAGGGGKGMYVVTDAAALPAALESAAREAAASFGDSTLLIERYVNRPRHIEVQVLADTHGTTLHLGERECSLQRRHQKVIEEAPSVFLTAEQRQRYGALAVATAQAVDYAGVGTVELIVSADAPDEPFFMEMNTRLQVEHPVTELVTGLDLVEQQMRVAAGEPLGFGQDDVTLHGHAVEARVYAEDPGRGFVPTGGDVLVLREATDDSARADGVRVDSALIAGTTVGSTYDPMLAKVIGYGPDRASALARLERALADTAVLGVRTNIRFLRALLADPDVVAGRLDTGLIERSMEELIDSSVPVWAYAAYAIARYDDLHDRSDPWTSLIGWRPGAPSSVAWEVNAPDGARLRLAATGRSADDLQLTIADATYAVSGHPAADGLLLTVAGTTRTVTVAVDGATVWVHSDATYAITAAPPTASREADAATDREARSPMPGSVIAIHVADGDQVEAGTALLAVEAMKMEHVVRAPTGGTVRLLVRAGDQVQVDQPLASIG